MLARVYQLEARDLEGDARKEAMEFVLEQYLHAIAVGSDEAMFALAGLYLDGDYGDDNVESGYGAAEAGRGSAESECVDVARSFVHRRHARTEG